MLGVSKQDNVTVHGDQMRPRSCRRTRRKQNAVHPFPSRGRQAQSCRRQFLQATPASDRPCDGIWHYSHVVVVSDSQLFLSTHSHGQATGLHNDVRELRRHDVRLSESIQLVLTFVEIQVDGKITTGIEDFGKSETSGQTSGAPVALMRLRTPSMGAMKVLGSVTSPTKMPSEASQAAHPNLSRAFVTFRKKPRTFTFSSFEDLVDHQACPVRGARDDDNVRGRSETQNRQENE